MNYITQNNETTRNEQQNCLYALQMLEQHNGHIRRGNLQIDRLMERTKKDYPGSIEIYQTGFLWLKQDYALTSKGYRMLKDRRPTLQKRNSLENETDISDIIGDCFDSFGDLLSNLGKGIHHSYDSCASGIHGAYDSATSGLSDIGSGIGSFFDTGGSFGGGGHDSGGGCGGGGCGGG